MKTKLSIFLLILVSLVSCGKKDDEDKNTSLNNGDNTQKNVVVDNGEKAKKEVENKELDENIDLYKSFKDGTLGNIVCKTHLEEEGAIIDSTTYISGIRMSSEMKVNIQGNTSTNYIISDGEYSYTWGNGMAIKVKIDEDIDTQEVDEELKESDDLYEYLKKMPYSDCKIWDIDEEKFKIPEDQKFTDITDGFDLSNMEDLLPNDSDGEMNEVDFDKIEDMMKMGEDMQ